MTVARLAVSFDAELARACAALLRAVGDWEGEHGEVGRAELDAVERRQRGRRRK